MKSRTHSIGSERPLTQREQEVLRVIEQFYVSHGYGPSYRDLAAKLKIKSTNGVADFLHALARKGQLAVVPSGKSRAFVPVRIKQWLAAMPSSWQPVAL